MVCVQRVQSHQKTSEEIMHRLILKTNQNNNSLGKYPDCGGYVLIEPHQEIAKWVVPLNDKEDL